MIAYGKMMNAFRLHAFTVKLKVFVITLKVPTPKRKVDTFKAKYSPGKPQATASDRKTPYHYFSASILTSSINFPSSSNILKVAKLLLTSTFSM